MNTEIAGGSSSDTIEKARQDGFPWSRSTYHTTYNAYLAEYKIQSCLDVLRARHPRRDTFGSLLDLACGDGMMTAMARPHFERVVGVDASAHHLAEARKRLPDVEFHECLIEEFSPETVGLKSADLKSAAKEGFDAVFLLDILEHVADPGLVLRKAASFLKDDGLLIVHVPNAAALNRKIAVRMGTLTHCEELSPFDIEIAGHRRAYTLQSLSEEIWQAGLPIEATGGVFLKMLSTPQMDWLLANGPWEAGGHGWGRTGAESCDWRAEFCRACYEVGKQYPEECNIIYAAVGKSA
jgi:2-polyprenyl-3-methyl-5-hydroxy-6-metoxy-1,4-benzoquinol methylase